MHHDQLTYSVVFHRYYGTQKRTLEINPRHPLVKELKRRMEADKEDQTSKDLAVVLFETATLRSGYLLQDSAGFAGRIERMLRLSMDISLEEEVRLCPVLGLVLLLRHDAVARILANGSVAFFESYAAIGWKACDRVR